MPTITVDKNALNILKQVKEKIKEEFKIEGVDYSDVIRFLYKKAYGGELFEPSGRS